MVKDLINGYDRHRLLLQRAARWPLCKLLHYRVWSVEEIVALLR